MELESFKPSAEVDFNLKNHIAFHGIKAPEHIGEILRTGFKSEYVDEGERFFRDGNLGIGIYISCNWKTALWFGRVLAEVSVQEGTRIFDASVPYDRSVLRDLERRFGKKITEAEDFRKEIPRNRTISFREFGELFKYHYQHLWPEPKEGRDNSDWPPSRLHHAKAIKACIATLRKKGYHGYGNPADDNGILVFQAERLRLERIVAIVPNNDHTKLILTDGLDKISFEDLSHRYRPSL